ncbi:MAG: hypothetical protein K2J82_09120 [Muribaculaceae bacterium]|nr:hypothetical protein [Muribaculaceae bacterium]
MDHIEMKNIEEYNTLHIESTSCSCSDCQNQRRHYVQILDMERYVKHLND